MTMLLAAVIVAVMVWALIKKYETRMVLIAGGLALACLAADPLEPLKAFSASPKYFQSLFLAGFVRYQTHWLSHPLNCHFCHAS